jgi:hypothetical protein
MILVRREKKLRLQKPGAGDPFECRSLFIHQLDAFGIYIDDFPIMPL